MVRIFCPPVELPIDDRDFAAALDEARRAVAHPPSIGRHAQKLDLREIRPRFRKRASRCRFGAFTRDDETDLFAKGEPSDDLGVDPYDGAELARPVGLV